MTKYKVGDKVRVRNDLVEGKSYYMDNGIYKNSFVDGMAGAKGKVVVITSADTQYKIKGYNYRWTDEMFETNKEVNEI